ncbi:NEAT domain-containing protein [Lysinibacillus sp. FSL W8-0992]|uniref:NEAT domain-containing protein n=1 Tax=Lysinibacillus sp. FSL W8-0992 TaxID=2954643 RepID=UPI0030FCF088
MKTYNRKGVFLLALISAIILVFIPQLPLHAQAEVDRSLGNGSYQVELSFSSLDGIEQNRFFNEEATLNVKNGKYTLSMTINHPYILQEVHIEQTEKTFSSILKWTENLVQFDVKDLKEPIMIKGLLASESEEDSFQFAQELRIILKAPIEENEQGTIIEETTPEKEWSIDYILYVDGKKEQSIMNTYVNPVAKMIKKDGKYYAQMTILKSAWVTGLTVDQRGQQAEPTLVSDVENERIVEFEVVDLERPLRMWVQVDIPEIAYHHQYFVDLQFDEQQVANILEKPIETEPPKQDINVKPPVVNSDKIEKPLEKKTEEPITKSNSISLPKVQPPFTALVEEQLAFDRTLDANAEEVVEEEPTVTEEEKQPNIEQAENKTNIDQQLAQLDKVKIVLLVLICILSGWLLVRRFKNSKNN